MIRPRNDCGGYSQRKATEHPKACDSDAHHVSLFGCAAGFAGEQACVVAISFCVAVGTVIGLVYIWSRFGFRLPGHGNARVIDSGAYQGRSSARGKPRRGRRTTRRRYY